MLYVVSYLMLINKELQVLWTHGHIHEWMHTVHIHTITCMHMHIHTQIARDEDVTYNW